MIRLLVDKIIPVLLLVIAIFAPTINPNFDVSGMLAPTTFIFSIFTGFFLADATANYRRLKLLITDENSLLVAIYKISKRFGSKKSEDIASSIDEYMIAQLDSPFLDHTQRTTKEFNDIIDKASKIDKLDSSMSNVLRTHHEMYTMAKKTIGRANMAIIVTLGFSLAILLLLRRGESMELSILIGLIIVSVYEVIKLLFDLDSNRFLARQLAYETPQQVFMNIGKLPYYPEDAFIAYKNKNPTRPYRLGRRGHNGNIEISIIE